MLFIDRQVNGIFAELFKFDLLQIQHDVFRQCLLMFPRLDIYRSLQSRHDVMTVEVDKIDGQAVFPSLYGFKADPQGDRALLKDHRNLFGPDGVKCPEDIQFSLLIGGGVA